jgi:hypothetical protein
MQSCFQIEMRFKVGKTKVGVEEMEMQMDKDEAQAGIQMEVATQMEVDTTRGRTVDHKPTPAEMARRAAMRRNAVSAPERKGMMIRGERSR